MDISKEQLSQILKWELGRTVRCKITRVYDADNPVEEKDERVVYEWIDYILGQATDYQITYIKIHGRYFISMYTPNDGEIIEISL